MPESRLSVLPNYAVLTKLVARSLRTEATDLLAAIRPARESDFEALVAFRQAHLHVSPKWDERRYLRWRYRFGEGAGGFCDLLMLQHRGETLAILGVEELTCRIDDTTVKGARGMDLLVRPDLRDSGLGAWLNQTLFDRYPFVLAMGANANSLGMVRKLFRPLPARYTYTHPLRVRPFAVRRWPRLRPLIAFLAPLADASLALRRRWLLPTRFSGMPSVPVERFSDDMFEALSPGQPGTVHICRSADHLNRRLLDNPRRRSEVRRVMGAATAGYAAWAYADDADGSRELHIIDWQYSSDSVFQSLLQEAVVQGQSAGCACVRITLQDSAEQRAARLLGFVVAADDRGRIVGVQAKDERLAERLVGARWALTDATEDADGF